MAPVNDVMDGIMGEVKAKGKGDKRYVAFSLKEWQDMEAAYGKTIQPTNVKKLVQGIFTGRYNVGPVKKA